MTGAIGVVVATQHDDQGTCVIALHGEHDLSTAPFLESRTSELWPRCSRAVVDLSDASFIDSSVINWLLRMRQTLAAAGREVCLVEGAADSFATLLIGALGLREQFACFRAREEALAARPAEAGSGQRRASEGPDRRRIG